MSLRQENNGISNGDPDQKGKMSPKVVNPSAGNFKEGSILKGLPSGSDNWPSDKGEANGKGFKDSLNS